VAFRGRGIDALRPASRLSCSNGVPSPDGDRLTLGAEPAVVTQVAGVFLHAERRAPVSTAQRTRDHDQIRKWIEDRKGRPSVVCATAGKGGSKKGGGLLRIDFGEADEGLEEIGWDEFFAIFDDNDLEFLHQDKTADGKPSRFSRFVAAGSDDD